MDGRWRIFKWGAFERVTDGPDTEDVWVVPCDDAAIERVAIRHWMREMSWSKHPLHLKAVRARWEKTTEKVRESYREVAREDLAAAAGETP